MKEEIHIRSSIFCFQELKGILQLSIDKALLHRITLPLHTGRKSLFKAIH